MLKPRNGGKMTPTLPSPASGGGEKVVLPSPASGRGEKEKWLPALIVLFGLVAAAVLAVVPDPRPEIRPASAPADAFSAERARKPLRDITRAPHEVGTAEHARIRAYLVHSLQQLGLQTEVQQATYVQGERGKAATVYNIVARLRGTNPSGTLLLAAHYDSVPNSYGASDDGSGIVAILETLRALRTGPRLRNDILVLFSDAEELGLVGAQAFVEEHPLARDIDLVLNLEARGTTGPLVMFRTSGPNSDLIRSLAGTGVMANSLTGEIFQRLPNDTDLSVFTEEGIPGMDFAFIEGVVRYHTPEDNFENQDTRTLQQMGATTLALTRHFGSQDFGARGTSNRVYFNMGRFGLIHYPASATIPLAVMAMLVSVVVVVLAWRKGELSVRGVFMGFLALLPGVGIPIPLAWLGWRQLGGLLEARGDLYAAVHISDALIAGSCMVAAAVASAVYHVFSRWSRPLEQYVPPLLVWASLGLVAAFLLPGGSFLFAWPTLFAAVGVLLLLYVRDPLRQALGLAVTAAPVVLLVFPWIPDLETAMTIQMLPVIVGLFMMLLVILLLQVQLVLARLGWVLPIVLLALGVALPVYRGAMFTYDAMHPKANTLGYLEDLDSGRAYWFTTDRSPDAWTGRFLGADPEPRRLPGFESQGLLRSAATSFQSLRAPELRVISDSTSAGMRHLHLHLSNPGAYAIGIQLLEDDLRPGDLFRENGAFRTVLRPSEGASRDRVVEFIAPPAAGMEIRIDAPANRKLRLRVRAVYAGLPGNAHRARPAQMIMRLRKSDAQSDMSTVQRTVVF